MLTQSRGPAHIVAWTNFSLTLNISLDLSTIILLILVGAILTVTMSSIYHAFAA